MHLQRQFSDIFKISFTEHYGFATCDNPEKKIVLETLAKFRKFAVIYFFNLFIQLFRSISKKRARIDFFF